MDNIDNYNDSVLLFNFIMHKKIISWITILILIIIIFIIFSNISYSKYKDYVGYIEFIDNNYYIEINLEEGDFPININNNLYINGKKYEYNIVSINGNSVILNIELEESYLINNNKVLLSILSEKTSLFKQFKKKIKKGLDL